MPQSSVLGPVLYQIYTLDIPTSDRTVIPTYADDTAILAVDKNADKASEHLKKHLNNLQTWLKSWKIEVNESKSVHIIFALRHGACPSVKFNNLTLPDNNSVRYLGIHLDKKFTWHKHIFEKRKQLGLKLIKLYWFINQLESRVY